MRKKTLVTLGITAIALLLAIGPAFHIFENRNSKINSISLGRITLGMSEPDVELVLGGPAGGYFSGSISFIYSSEPPRNRLTSFSGARLDEDMVSTWWSTPDGVFFKKGWIGQDLAIWVVFDHEGKVVATDSSEVRSNTYGFLRAVRRWFR